MVKSSRDLEDRRRVPFAVATCLFAIVLLLVFRLPESFVAQLERGRPFSSGQAGWIYRLLAIAAAGQMLYGGFVLLRPERVELSAAESRSAAIASVARVAAFMTALSWVYGLAAFALTGERAGFWLFAVIVVLQSAWYYRQCGQVADWIGRQPEPGPDS